MPFVAQTGNTIQTLADARFQWKVHDFFSLSDKVDDYYDSPVFCFADSRWYMRLYPNGETECIIEGIVNLYLCREDKHPRRTVRYKFGILCSDGEVKEVADEEEDFSEQNNIWGDEFYCRSRLRDEAPRLVPDNILTIVCHLKCSEPNVAKISLSNRLWDVSRNMGKILADGKRTDFTLKSGHHAWPVHRVVLETRSDYFANMFSHEWTENTAGEATFEDIDGVVLGTILNFLYTGHVEDCLSVENVCGVYAAAHKFLLDDLRALCVQFVKGNMRMEMVCKVLVLADTYGDKDLKHIAIKYFSKETDEVFDSEEWKELKRNHLSLAAELLEEATKRERKKRRRSLTKGSLSQQSC